MKRTRWKRIALALQFDDYSDNLLESSLSLTVYDYGYGLLLCAYALMRLCAYALMRLCAYALMRLCAYALMRFVTS